MSVEVAAVLHQTALMLGEIRDSLLMVPMLVEIRNLHPMDRM